MNKTTILKLPRCPECGGAVEMRKAAGRTREFRRGVLLEIPQTFGIPTCTRCGEESMIPEVSDELDRVLGEAYRAQQAQTIRVCVDVIRLRHDVSQREIEKACGVTASYLSHMMSGKKETSLTLMRLIEIFALSPEAFEHASSGVPFDKHMIGLFEIAPRRTYRAGANFRAAGSYARLGTYAPMPEKFGATG
jgi:transcriptional regulator with XRE-family HTH domain/ribosomal protein S27AE